MPAAALEGTSGGLDSSVRAGDPLLPRDERETDTLFPDQIPAEYSRPQGVASQEKWHLPSKERMEAEPSATPLRTLQPRGATGHLGEL